MSGYIGAQPVPQATQHREAFTATASQTSFATVGYTPQFVDVYLNGVKLAAADYTATNGSDIVLATGAALNDILEYVAYTPFEVASQTFTGTTTADVLTTTGRLTLPTNTYHYSSDGKSRLYYYDNGDTLFRTADDFLFRNNTNTTVAQLSGTGSLTVSGGIYLGGTAAANKLDDYEEGTWTPSMAFGAGSVGLTYAARTGTYTKIGNVVTASCYIGLSAKGSSVGSININGYPFTSNPAANTYFTATFWSSKITYTGTVQGYAGSGTTIGLSSVSEAGTNAVLTNTNCANDSDLMINVTYNVG